MAGLFVIAALTACGTVSSPLPDAARPMKAPTTPALVVPGPSTASPACGDLTASLRPPAVLPGPGAMPAGSYLETIAERGYLTVGVRPDTPPFDSLTPDTNQFEGFEIDIAKLVAAAIFGPVDVDKHVKFHTLTAAERISSVQSGKLDMTTATITVTCDRLTQVDFSSVYYLTSKAVLVQRGSGFRGLEDLGGRRVCAASGTTSIQRVVDAPSHPVAVPVANVAACLVALQNGSVDAVVNDEIVLAGMAAQDPETEIVGQGPDDVPVAAAVSKAHPELTRFINGVLAAAASDGTWTRIYNQRLLKDLHRPAPVPPAARYRD
ncbi:transporter substrate-binding domain-containing protein [Pseudofrankia sp. BMG5.37]|uniref:transporter substrate-binding domain-containing protein n=1 Tax=Pseudofrankia sp. BMG5.37 TaxID=3050035 RepID=UPI00289550CE|nr:transporter substrate-binding domain-containing protein [Pseudofrankia sp. BMG5.37]MDT3438027.1 transporter substrate-binding domain-containing protein [Pseudofrankia sp. BMG5.37]